MVIGPDTVVAGVLTQNDWLRTGAGVLIQTRIRFSVNIRAIIDTKISKMRTSIHRSASGKRQGHSTET